VSERGSETVAFAEAHPGDGGPHRSFWPRHQPPVYSPIGIPGVARGGVAAVGVGPDPRSPAEAFLRQSYDAEAVVLCGSGTQALVLALRAAARQRNGGVVALPAYTCFDVAAAAVAAECRIVLYDIDPRTLTPDLDSLRATVRAGARVVVVAPLYGLPPDWAAIEQCLAATGATVIEDAAQGHGAQWGGRPLGSLAPLSVLSFGRGKGWTAGRGGALLVRGGAETPSIQSSGGLWAEVSVLLGAAAQRVLGGPTLYALPAGIPWLGLGETRYRPASDPSRMTRAAAALLMHSRSAAEAEADARRRWGQYWHGAIRQRPGVETVMPLPGASPGYLRYPLRLARGLAGFPDARLANRLGVAPGYPLPLSALGPVRRWLTGPSPGLPGAEELARTLVTLPTHARLGPQERDRIVSLLADYQP
jgi:perosamine synthetase